MTFSIIIACYNLGKLVCDAIESCVHQVGISSDEVEILVINDGSTDDTLDYIKKYEKVRNVVIYDKPNAGLSNTRNFGLAKAIGDYVLFLDGDDWYAHNALEELSKHIGKSDIIAFPMIHYYSENNHQVKLHGLQEKIYSKEDFLQATLGKKQFNIIPAPKKLYKRSFLTNHNIKFIEGILHEDNPFFIDVMNVCSDVYYVDTPIYYYRLKRDGSITSQCTFRNFDGVMKGIEYINTLQIHTNRNVAFLNANMMVFQVIGNYNSESDRRIVFSELRSLKSKKRLFNYLFKQKFSLKHTIRLLLLLLDPCILKIIIKLL